MSLLIQMRLLFHWRKQYYWWSNNVKRTLSDDFFFFLQTCIFIYFLLYNRWIKRLEWCGLLWCFISCLDSHSDGTHSLQRINWWVRYVMLHFSKSVFIKKQTHLYLRWPEDRVGFRNPVPIWHRYLCNRYVLEPNQNADFGASFRCRAWVIDWSICPLFLRNGRKNHHHRHRTWKIISRLRKCTWTQFGKL